MPIWCEIQICPFSNVVCQSKLENYNYPTIDTYLEGEVIDFNPVKDTSTKSGRNGLGWKWELDRPLPISALITVKRLRQMHIHYML